MQDDGNLLFPELPLPVSQQQQEEQLEQRQRREQHQGQQGQQQQGQQEEWKPNVMVLGPGGAKAYMELGALLKFESLGYFRHVTHWTGCSAGAAIALLIVAGYTITEIIRETFAIDILKDITDLLNNITGLESLMHILERKGLFSNRQVQQHITKKIQQKFGNVPTLRQLYMATGLHLTMVTYNIDKERVEYLDKDSEPNLCCVQAAMMSMAVPFLMQCRLYKGCEYIDGAVGDPYSIGIHDNGENIILGIYVLSDTQDSDKNASKIKYLYRVGHASINQLREQNIKYASDRCKHLPLVSPLLDTTGLSFSDENKEELMKIGYRAATQFVEKLSHPEKYNVLLSEDEEIPFDDEVEAVSNEVNDDDDDDVEEEPDNIITVEITPSMRRVLARRNEKR